MGLKMLLLNMNDLSAFAVTALVEALHYIIKQEFIGRE